MAQISRQAGTTGHITHIFVQDTSRTDGGGLAGLTNVSSGLACAYKRNRDAAAVAVTLDAIVTLGAYGTYAAGHGGFKEVDAALWPGLYEFQAPNAAMAAGAGSVAFSFKGAANMASTPLFVELTATNNQDGVAGGMTNLDAAITSRSTYAGGAVASVTAPVTAGTVSDKSGYSLATAPPTLTQVVNGVWDEPKSGHATASTFGAFLDAAVSTRLATSGYAAPSDPWAVALPGGYGTGTAGKILGTNLDAAVSTRSTYAGADTAGTATLLSRLTPTRATGLDNLDAAISSRLATASYAAAPTAAAVATAVWTDTTSGDFAAAGSPGKVLVGQLGGGFTTGSSSVFATAALANAPTGGGAGAATIAAAVWDEAKASHATAGTFGALLDAAVSTRSTFAGGAVASVTAPVTVGTISDKAGYSLAPGGLDAVSVEPGINFRQSQALALAVLAGTTAGAGTGTYTFYAAGVSPPAARLVATFDDAGDRAALTLSPPA